MYCCADLSLEDSGNYTCEIRGRGSVVKASVTHYIFVRGKLAKRLSKQKLAISVRLAVFLLFILDGAADLGVVVEDCDKWVKKKSVSVTWISAGKQR